MKKEHEKEIEAVQKSEQIKSDRREKHLKTFSKWKEFRLMFENKRETLIKMLKKRMIVKRWISLMELNFFLCRLIVIYKVIQKRKRFNDTSLYIAVKAIYNLKTFLKRYG